MGTWIREVLLEDRNDVGDVPLVFPRTISWVRENHRLDFPGRFFVLAHASRLSFAR
jgi:hypothetical protein